MTTPDAGRNDAVAHTTQSHAASHHAAPRPKALTALTWGAQVAAAAILGQSLFFKFGGAPETVALFEVLGAEPFGRYAVGAAELVAVVLLLVPRTAWAGGIFSVGIIGGAIMGHLTKLGISIDPEALGKPALEALAGPSLFAMAVVVLLASLTVVFVRRGEIPVVGPMLVREQPKAETRPDAPASIPASA
ncbi:MAG: DoxX family protein [Planctomycetota bacterium]